MATDAGKGCAGSGRAIAEVYFFLLVCKSGRGGRSQLSLRKLPDLGRQSCQNWEDKLQPENQQNSGKKTFQLLCSSFFFGFRRLRQAGTGPRVFFTARACSSFAEEIKESFLDQSARRVCMGYVV